MSMGLTPVLMPPTPPWFGSGGSRGIRCRRWFLMLLSSIRTTQIRITVGMFATEAIRIPDLYPALPVVDSAVSVAAGGPRLKFSGAPTRADTVEVSSDLLQWELLGTAIHDPESGALEFQDAAAVNSGLRFYRVITQR